MSKRSSVLAIITAKIMLLATAGFAPGSTLTVKELFGFPSGSTVTSPDGSLPAGPLIQASDGNFYGTTSFGGDDGNKCSDDCHGTVFKITAQGHLTVLYTFGFGSSSAPYANGGYPLAGLVEGRDGYLYGTTSQGGNRYGDGIVFKISKTGQFKTLHDFCQTDCSDGETPKAGLVLGRDGYFYGTTSWGGTYSGSGGTIFRIDSNGRFIKLNQFNTSTGCCSQASLIQASDGDFYGTAELAVFRVTPSGKLTILHSFGTTDNCASQSDGCHPTGSLIQGTDGDLYGVTYDYGAHNAGTIYKVSLTGHFEKIFDLDPNSEGTSPNSLLQASDADLWGTSFEGANNGSPGWVYRITTAGSFVDSTRLTQAIGPYPLAALIQGTDAKLYGTSNQGGNPSGNGSIFTIDAGLPLPKPTIITFSPVSGAVGTTVTIQGTYFVGTEFITFNGVSAEFKVEANGVISAIVPKGATTGPIEVKNAGGSVASHQDFKVE